MFTEILKSSKTAVNDRVSSPLAGAFVTSWCIVNYQIIVHLLMGSESATERLNHIHHLEYLNTNPFLTFSFMFSIPFLSALAWIYIYPKFAKEPFEYAMRVQVEQMQRGMEIKGDRMYSRNEYEAIRGEKDEAVLLERKLKSEYSELVKKVEEGANTAIAGLKQQIDKLSDELSQSDKDHAYKNSLIISLQSTIGQLGQYKSAIEKQGEEAARRARDEAKGRAMERGYSVGGPPGSRIEHKFK